MNAKNDTAVGTQHTVKRAVRSLTPFEQVAWVLALLLFGVGDIATTAVGLQLGAIELSPGGIWLFETVGVLPGMVMAKAGVLFTAAFFFSKADERYRVILPAPLALLGVVATVLNLRVVFILAGWI